MTVQITEATLCVIRCACGLCGAACVQDVRGAWLRTCPCPNVVPLPAQIEIAGGAEPAYAYSPARRVLRVRPEYVARATSLYPEASVVQ